MYINSVLEELQIFSVVKTNEFNSTLNVQTN